MWEILLGVIGTGLLGVIGWAFHLNSRVAVLEAEKISFRELLEAKLENITIRLDRIERKLDKEE